MRSWRVFNGIHNPPKGMSVKGFFVRLEVLILIFVPFIGVFASEVHHIPTWIVAIIFLVTFAVIIYIVVLDKIIDPYHVLDSKTVLFIFSLRAYPDVVYYFNVLAVPDEYLTGVQLPTRVET